MKQIKTGIIITGGATPNFDKIKNLFTEEVFCVCADSGWDYANKNNIDVNLIIGDLDSVSTKIDPKITIEKFPVDKDFSDTELAIQILEKQNIENYFIVGGGEGRCDHFLSLLTLLSKYYKIKKWFTKNEIIIPLHKKGIFNFEIEKKTKVSIFPLSEKVIVNTNGLKWELNNFTLDKIHHSLSNENKRSNLEIEIQSGELLLIINFNS